MYQNTSVQKQFSKKDIYDKNNLQMNLASNQYTLFDSLRFSHSDCGSSHVKANIIGRKIVAHSGLEPATFELQTFRCTAL